MTRARKRLHLLASTKYDQALGRQVSRRSSTGSGASRCGKIPNAARRRSLDISVKSVEIC
jgi:hypothetical protein